MHRQQRRSEVLLGGRRVHPFEDNPAQSVFLGGQQQIPATVTLTGGATRTFQVRGTNTKTLYVDYGDGSALDTITLLGTSTDVQISHAYSAGTYRMRIYGDLDEVFRFRNGGVSQGVQAINFSAFKSDVFIQVDMTAESDLSDISSLHGLPILDLRISGSGVSNIGVIGSFPDNFSNLFAEGNGIPDISALANKTGIDNLWLADNNISDCSPIENLADPVYVRLQSNIIDTLPDSFQAWDSIPVYFQNNGAGFPTDECLQKMAASGMTNNTINIAGTNPARTQPDTDAYVATIVTTNGNALTVNE